MRSRSISLIAAICIATVGCDVGSHPPARFVREVSWGDQGTWLKADTHLHSRFSDGAHSIAEVVDRGVKNGCQVLAIADHGDSELRAATPEYFAEIAESAGKHPDAIVLAGLEWNVPPWGGDEHATLLFPPHPDRDQLMQLFKLRFDDWKRGETDRALVGEALRWLGRQKNAAGRTPLLLYNHPSRKRETSQSFIDEIREWRATNDVLVGFSGAPGHQRTTMLGAYEGTLKPIDRWDPAVAEIGGSWDQLIAAGIDVWAARAPSDFHSPAQDYWPGEFSETWLYVPEPTVSGVVQAFRAGRFFGVHGHVAREVDLLATVVGLPRPAHAGEAIVAPPGTPVTVELRCHVPEVDWQGRPNQLTEVEFIAIGSDTASSHVRPVEAAGDLRRSVQFQIPADGFSVRARGRRAIPNGPDLLFYTNPIRIDAHGQVANHASGRRRDWVSVIAWGIIGLVVVSCFASVYVVGHMGVHSAPRREAPVQPGAAAFFWLTVFFVALGIYGSLVPLNYRPLAWEDAVSRFQQIRYLSLGPGRRADWVANILLFVPISFFGLAFVTSVLRSRVGRILAAPVVLALCVALSVALEFTQLWFPPRTVSQNDIVAEVIGSIVGASLWLFIGSAMSRWVGQFRTSMRTKSQVEWTLEAYAVGFLIYAVLPLDITINLSELGQKLTSDRTVLIPLSDWSWDAASLYVRLRDVLLAMPLGMLAVVWRLPRGRTARPLGVSVLAAVIMIAVVEFCQLLIISRYASTTDICTGALGAYLGATLMRRWRAAGKRFWEPPSAPARVWFAAATGYAVLLGVVFCAPLEPIVDQDQIITRMEGFFRTPFAALYWGSEYNAISDILRKSMFYAPLGLLLALGLRRRDRQLGGLPPWMLVAVTCALCSFVVELAQVFFPPRISDVTDVILSTMGGVFGWWLANYLLNDSAEGDPAQPHTPDRRQSV